MHLTYDQQADALYLQLVSGRAVSRTEQVDAGTLVDLDRLGNVLGIEVLRPARAWPLEEVLGRFGVDAPDASLLRRMFEGEERDTRYPFSRPARIAASA